MFQDPDTSFYLYFQAFFPYFFISGQILFLVFTISCFLFQYLSVWRELFPIQLWLGVHLPLYCVTLLLQHCAGFLLPGLVCAYRGDSSLGVSCLNTEDSFRYLGASCCLWMMWPPTCRRPLIIFNHVMCWIPYSTYTGIRSQIMMSMYAAESCLSTKEKWCVNHRLLKKYLQMFNSCSNVLAWYWLTFGQYFSWENYLVGVVGVMRESKEMFSTHWMLRYTLSSFFYGN